MALAKPTDTVDWGPAGTSPTNGDKTAGFAVGDRPPAAWFNWFWKSVSNWLAWLTQYFVTSGTNNVNLTLSAIDSGAGTDQDGGDLTLESGATTGNKGSKLVLRAAEAGATGTTARTPADYVVLNGDAGRVDVERTLYAARPGALKEAVRVVNNSGDPELGPVYALRGYKDPADLSAAKVSVLLDYGDILLQDGNVTLESGSVNVDSGGNTTDIQAGRVSVLNADSGGGGAVGYFYDATTVGVGGMEATSAKGCPLKLTSIASGTGNNRGDINVTQKTEDPASPQNGDVWFRSDTKQLCFRTGGTVYRVTLS